MLDLKLVRDNPEFVKAGIRKKHRDASVVDRALEVDRRRRELVQEVERLRAEQNRASAEIPKLTGGGREERIAQMRDVATRLKGLDPELKRLEEELSRVLLAFPNLPHETVPPGSDERENILLHSWGTPPEFAFSPKDHLELGSRLGIFDVERGAKVGGSRAYYLRGAGVFLEQALMRFAFELLAGEGFTPILPPFLVRPDVLQGAYGGAEVDVQQVYRIEGEDLVLIGTSEQSLAGFHKDETLDERLFPIRLAGLSWCFRREAGSHGKDVHGIYRVHQFDKVEMFSLTLPETSWTEHEYLLSLEERLMQQLGLPYRVVILCGGETSTPSAKTYDVETWMPSRGGYGETQSCSNCTDFQARRLSIRVRRAKGTTYAHTLNGTALATPRLLIPILENNQQPDGSVRIPQALVPYMHGRTVLEAPA